MEVDYDILAKDYERTRGIEPIVYSTLSTMLTPSKGDKILDFGCGTGSYLKQFVLDYEIEPYGIEPAKYMREIAQKKLSANFIHEGNHTKRPFPGIQFDKLYCTDVIHHLSQLDELFLNLFDASKTGAKFCICTESPHQLGEKYWIKYFPEILEVDLRRFHTIEDIIQSGCVARWKHRETLTIEDELIGKISSNFMERVRNRTLSVLRLISEEAFRRGLVEMERDYRCQTTFLQREGYTFILFDRE